MDVHHAVPGSEGASKILVIVAVAAVLGSFAIQRRNPLFAQVKSHARVLIFGGGSSHSFLEDYKQIDSRTLVAAGYSVRYTENFTEIPHELDQTDVLIQASNQTPAPDSEMRRSLVDFINAGGGLIAVHAGTWYNWPSWPEYNRIYLGGGSRSHDKFGEFEVMVTAPDHPMMKGVPAHFKIFDELYHQEMDPLGSPVEVLAMATSPVTGKTYPVIWVVKQGHGRIVCLTLGHDEKAHNDSIYERILMNATSWTAKK